MNPRAGSSSPFSLLEQYEDIIRVVAFHNYSHDYNVINYRPRKHSNVVNSICADFGEPKKSLGRLDLLPLELLNAIVLELDMATLMRFRHVNRRARHIVNSVPEYRRTATHSLTVIRALHETGHASNVTLRRFYDPFCTPDCSICGCEYAELVNLPLWLRFCYVCLAKQSREIRMADADFTKRMLRKSLLFKQLPIVQGIQGWLERPRRRLVTLQAVLSVYRANSGGADPDEDWIEEITKSGSFDRMVCCPMPTWNAKSDRIEIGLSCAGCQLSTDRWLREVTYSQTGFIAHYEGCAEAQDLWESSMYGTIDPPNLPKACMNGPSSLARLFIDA